MNIKIPVAAPVNVDQRIALSLVEAGRLTGKPPSTLRRLAKQGKIPARKLGKAWLLPVSFLDEIFPDGGNRAA
jgi:excisionase family DNA binding protein